MSRTRYNGYTSARTVVTWGARGVFQACSVSAAPMLQTYKKHAEDTDDPSLWLYLGMAAILVLLGGAFAGLTIALMGQDGIYLQVIAQSGEGKEQRHAQRVHRLLNRGKHWVLVTLLLSNVIVNETLPIVLDRSLGGGWPAVLGSTALIVIFGEVIPQSVCVRYGLSIGAYCAPFVLGLMYLLAPIAYPTAKLLDKLLGEDHGTVYKKSGLKTLVTLHQSLGSAANRLNEDEVTIISSVLDLKEKPIGDIMTPMEDVFTMSADDVLDKDTIKVILDAGYSRIPIYEPGNTQNFVGMLLVKILIAYDPEDCKKVGEFALATLPETQPETSCLDIVNFFQEGKSHMVLVSETPGEIGGAIGVVTLEDVMEELIGEEIIDESDVYIDVHKAIRRMAPAPKARIHRAQILAQQDGQLIDLREEISAQSLERTESRNNSNIYSSSPKTTFLRRASTGTDGKAVQVRGNFNDMREHLKHLAPSNLASRPKTTRFQTVKIKPGHTLTRSGSRADSTTYKDAVVSDAYQDLSAPAPAPGGGEGEGLLKSAGREASDGVQALQQGYGSFDTPIPGRSLKPDRLGGDQLGEDQLRALGGKISPNNSRSLLSSLGRRSPSSSDTLGSLKSHSSSPPRKRGVARSGSITEDIIEAGGIRKVVLRTHSGSSDEGMEESVDERNKENPRQRSFLNLLDSRSDRNKPEQSVSTAGEEVKKKRRRKRKSAKKVGDGSTAGSSTNEHHG